MKKIMLIMLGLIPSFALAQTYTPPNTWDMSKTNSIVKSSIGVANGVASLNSNGEVTSPINTNKIWYSNSIQNYDGTQDASNGNPLTILPSVSLPCHAIQQAYVMSSNCIGTVFSNALESYAYNYGAVNLDDGTIPSNATTASNVPDKVTMYVSGDQRSTNSSIWGMNLLIGNHPDTWNGLKISSISVTNGGSGYTSVPTVTITTPDKSGTSSATATISNGSVTAITLNSSGVYKEGTAVTVTISGGGATTSATATATLTANKRFRSAYGLEMDMGNGHDCTVPTDSTGTSDCPGNMGLWITGASLTGQATGPAEYITSVGTNPLFDDGIIFAGNSIRDSTIFDNTTSSTSLKVGGTHNVGLSLFGAKFNEAAIKLASGPFWGDNAQYQGIEFVPPNGVGATDWIRDQGPGLDLSSTQRLTISSPYTYTTGSVVNTSTGKENYMIGEDIQHSGGIGVDFDGKGTATASPNDWSFLTMTAGKYSFSMSDGTNKYDLLTIKNGYITTTSGTKICLDGSCNTYMTESTSGTANINGNVSVSNNLSSNDIITTDTTTPTSTTSCTKGSMHSDDTNLYICTSALTYKKVPLQNL